MIQPPSGTVTFMFTDIEGSTKLWEQHREAMNLALKRHDELLRQAIEAHRGYIFKTVGDAFCAAFASPTEAAAAALQAQQLLQSQNWGETAIKVRMGLHTGEAHEREGDYFGPTLNRTARLMSIGHGGQVLLSQATQEMLANRLPSDASLRDLGFHRLKDLAQPEHVYHLVRPDLPQEFTALNSLSYLANNLPAQTTRFIGRETEIQKISHLLSESKLVTLTGIGGTGKTRLALQVAAERIDQYADGVWLVELAPLGQSSLVASSIADVLKVAELPGKAILDVLKERLKKKHLLLVLDNCEHLVEACAQVADSLLKACPQLRILASSREALSVPGEILFAVPPLPVPQADHKQVEVAQTAAVQLFVERGRAAKPSFELSEENAQDVAEICRKLEGIPLALELAAARVKVIPPRKMVEYLDDRFRLLTGGARTGLAHHQTLRATIDWSYELLGEAEQTLLQRLSVFRGGSVLEAVERVCAGEGLVELVVLDYLSQLVQKSLVEVDEQGEEARYRLLETVRQYAEEKLAETGGAERLGEMHLSYYLDLAERAEPQLTGAEQGKWMQHLEREHENLRRALGWALERRKAEKVQRLGGALGRFWRVRGYLTEGRHWLNQGLRQREGVSKAAQVKVVVWAGTLARLQGDDAEARRLFEESLKMHRELGNTQGIASALNSLGLVAQAQGDYAGARKLYEESLLLSREQGDKWGIAMALINLGNVAAVQGDNAGARKLYEESLLLSRELGNKDGIAIALNNLGLAAQAQGDNAGARKLYEESLLLSRELGHKQGIATALNNLGLAAQAQGDNLEARKLYEESLSIRRELGHKWGIATVLSGLASLMSAEGQGEQAAQLQGAVIALLEDLGTVLEPMNKADYEKSTSALQATLGEEGYRHAFEAGKRLTLDEAIALALREPETASNTPA